MAGVQSHSAADGEFHGTLDCRSAGNLLKALKNNWMVAKDQVASARNRFSDHGLVGIKAAKHPRKRPVPTTYKQPAVVVGLLKPQGRARLQQMGKFSDGHDNAKKQKDRPLWAAFPSKETKKAALYGRPFQYNEGCGLLLAFHFFFQTSKAVEVPEGRLFNLSVNGLHRGLRP
jgi:hypothetical protein